MTRRFLITIVTALIAATAAQADTFVYVSVAAEKRIAVYRLDADTGKLTHKSDFKVADGEPGALTVDPTKRFLLAAIRSTGKLASFRIDTATGKLTHANTVLAGPDPAHISTDRTGRYLLAAYYVDAKVTVHAIGKDGMLSEKPLQSILTADKAHAIVPDPSNRFVFVPHTGPDAIFQFTFDAKTGRLSANAPANLQTPKGTGPRHLAFHPSKPIAYVDNEQGSGITAYALDEKAGSLKALQTVSTLPREFKGTNACAEIKVHPSGRFAYVSNRGHDSVAAFALDDDGKLSVIGHTATETTPRSFDIDPSGKYLFAAGESSGKLAGYRINPKTGELTRFETHAVGKMPWWVMAVDLPPQAQGGKDAKPERVGLWNKRAPIGDGKFQEAEVWITVHHPKKPNGTAIVICPGGGYGGLVTGAEGHGIASWLNRHDITGVVLEYRMPAGRSQVPLLDAQRALRTVRANAKGWNLEPARIGIMGFSAGGHLASTAGTHFDAGDADSTDPIQRVSCRPDFMVLVYPVITMGDKGHQGSRNNLLGKNPDPRLVELFSNEKQVTAKTPPAFLAHAKDDRVVPPENSRMFRDALRSNKVAAEYLELPSGGHGLNGYKGPQWDAWQERSLSWLAEMKLVPASR